ncbi:phytoene desaturase family protein [Phytohabitans sp. ZYX-F-186]|uniref:Phytoene desaturase family protein n=1 Tax=Phytohabitans maris TaxID=3071409 RepID=A0ABU0ZFR9_9ACTN|nr:phytoene desaturase family protein [Phytohabitans sp. ZYX-F-186]MDQ7905899.1 phytoene desaturase family protein [Phytohabitans sp. ZYX-F-186]
MNVVVVGAGVGGLAVAARLAAAGHAVTVLERSEAVGGKLGRYARDGFVFDTGPSLLTLPEVFGDLLLGPFRSRPGEKGWKTVEPVPLDPIVRHRFADGTVLDSGRDPDAFAARVGAALGPAAAAEWAVLWRRAGRIWDTSWRHVLRTPLSPARQAWRLRDLWAIRPGQSLRGVGVRDPRLRMFVERYATYAGADPRRAPAALLAAAYAELAFGGWYLPGGLATLAGALLSRCLDLGVVVQFGTAVTAVDAAGGRVHGVRAGRERIPADAVVTDIDAGDVYRDLLPTPRRLARLADRSLAGFVLLLGVRGDSGLAHHNVYFPEDYDAEFDAVFGDPGRGVRARPAPDPTVYVTVAADPLVRPAGHEAWFVLVNAARQGTAPDAVDWRRPGLAEAYADRILDVLESRGVPVRDRLVFREVLLPGDPIYGTAGSLRRPANRGPVEGMYLVGGSVHPGGGLPLVALGAEIVASALLSRG